MTVVVAGILQRENKILACQRRPGQPHELKWEFPGGKVEPGETPEEAIRRELYEELAIECVGAEEIDRYTFSYPGKKPILLIFMRVISWRGEMHNLIFNSIAWQSAESLRTLDFLEGDLPFLTRFEG